MSNTTEHTAITTTPCFSLDSKGQFLSVNSAWETLTGLSQKEVQNHSWLDYTHPDNQNALEAAWQTLENTSQTLTLEYTFVTSQGIQRKVIQTLGPAPANSKAHFQGHLIDNTPSKQQQNIIDLQSKKLDAIYRSSNMIIIILDLEHRVLEFNQIAADTTLMRFKRQIQKGDNFTLYVQPDRLDDFHQSFSKALAGQNDFKERLIYAKDAHPHTYEMAYTPIYNPQGEVYQICFTALDVEDQKQRRNLLSRERTFASTVLSTTSALIAVLQPNGLIMRFNKACERLTQFSESEIFGKPFWDLIPIADIPSYHNSLAELTPNQPQTLESYILDKHDSKHLIHWTMKANYHPDGTIDYIVFTGIDKTQQESMQNLLQHREEMLRQAQKMESMGQMVGSVAHDFNNILVGILGYSQMLEENLSDPHKVLHYTQEIQRISEKAQKLTQEMLFFSKKPRAQKQKTHLNRLIQEFKPLLKQLLNQNIQSSITLDEKVGMFEADPVHIEQLVMNLSVNARDAMSGEGQLEITTGIETIDPHSNREIPPGNYTTLEVKDTGCGIPQDVQKHIFEPFFTTKEKGTGLGLAIIFGIVKDYKGYLSLKSKEGQGTTIKIYFPSLQDKTLKNTPQEEQPTLLLYHIDSSTQKEVTQALDKWGYPYTLLTKEKESKVEHCDIVLAPIAERASLEALALEKPFTVVYLCHYSDPLLEKVDSLQSHEDILLSPFARHQLKHSLKRALKLLKSDTMDTIPSTK